MPFISRLILFLTLACTQACKPRGYHAGSASMEKTIMRGEEFTIEETEDFKKGDIAVFIHDYFPLHASAEEERTMVTEKRVCRIVAVSGDSLLIRNDTLFLNGRMSPFPEHSLMPFEVLSSKWLDSLSQEEIMIAPQASGDTIRYVLFFTEAEAHAFAARHPQVFSISRTVVGREIINDGHDGTTAVVNWTKSDFGPLAIPSPGDTVEVNDINLFLFRNIPGIKPGINVLSEKLYFLLGDNRYHAEDSRFFGLIPHSKMFGIVK